MVATDVCWTLLFLAVGGATGNWQSSLDGLVPTLWEDFITGAMFLWSFVISVAMVAEVQRFSLWRAFDSHALLAFVYVILFVLVFGVSAGFIPASGTPSSDFARVLNRVGA